MYTSMHEWEMSGSKKTTFSSSVFGNKYAMLKKTESVRNHHWHSEAALKTGLDEHSD